MVEVHHIIRVRLPTVGARLRLSMSNNRQEFILLTLILIQIVLFVIAVMLSDVRFRAILAVTAIS